jgi:hypothetical protein
MEEPKGYQTLLLIIALPCITFTLAITLLGIAKPIMQGLGRSIHHQATFPLVPSHSSSSLISENA